jgi:hypothetical protein
MIAQPPEVLGSILHQFQELANDLWPELPGSEKADNLLSERQNGTAGIEGM